MTSQDPVEGALLGKIFYALKVLPLEWEDGGLRVIGDMPEWVGREFADFRAEQMPFRAEAMSPFLENFIIDAEAFWQERPAQFLRSGVWTETGSSGNDIHLEAIALFLDERRIVLIESSESAISEKFKWLQVARQEQLSFISERKAAADKISRATLYDSLTGLPNRSFFLSQLESLFEKSQWSDSQQFAVVVFNLDRFQTINNSLGTAAGDQVLLAVSKRLQACLRKSDVPGHFSADEFGVLLSQIEQEQTVTALVQRILDTIHQPFVIDGRKIRFTASAGIAIQADWYQSSRDLLRDASLAMQQAQRLGRGRYVVFEQEMRSRAFELWNLESDLHTAVARQELQLWYQPIISLNTHKVESFEALLRWFHPSRGWIPPSKFIPIAEENGLISTIDRWVLNTACQTIKQWQTATNQTIRININISPQHFTEVGLFEEIQQAVASAQIPPNPLRVEITESLLLDDTSTTIVTLNQIKSLGLEIAIDDFGTGYASLSYLQDLPLDKLKIDGYFIDMMENNGPDIVHTIIELAHKLGFGVTAERVETVEQYRTLQGLGCDTAQGYLFSRPVPLLEAQNLIDAEFVVYE